MSTLFDHALRRSPSGPLIDFGIDTDLVQNVSDVPGDSVTDALDTIFAKRVNYIDTTDDPLALWNFNDTIQAVRGPPLAISTGPWGFCDVYPGVRGLDIGIATRLEALLTPNLILLGDMSVELLMLMDSNPTNQWIVGVGGANTGAAANNVSWSLIFPVTVPPRSAQVFWESGGGTDRGFTTPVTNGSPSLPPIHNLFQFGFSRSGINAQCYMNGRPFGALTSGVAAPTSGQSGVLTLGGRAGAVSTDQYQVLSLAVFNRSRPASEWRASYNRTIGNGLGPLT